MSTVFSRPKNKDDSHDTNQQFHPQQNQQTYSKLFNEYDSLNSEPTSQNPDFDLSDVISKACNIVREKKILIQYLVLNLIRKTSKILVEFVIRVLILIKKQFSVIFVLYGTIGNVMGLPSKNMNLLIRKMTVYLGNVFYVL